MPFSFSNNSIPFVQRLENELVTSINRFPYVFIVSLLVFISGAAFYLKSSVTNYQLNGALAINSEKIYTEAEILRLIDTLKSSKIKNDRNALSLMYFKNLDISPGQIPNTIIFSLKNSNPQTAKAFIDRIIEIYQQNKKDVAYRLPEHIGDSIQLLHKQLLVTQQKMKSNFTISKDNLPNSTNAEMERKIKILNQIEYYANKSLKTFVVIPDAYVANDNKLKPLIDDFNATQFRKQNSISTDGANALQVINLEKQLSQLQIIIGKEIQDQKNKLKYASVASTSASPLDTVSALKLTQSVLLSKIDSLQIRQSIARIRASQTSIPLITRSDFEIEPLQPNSIYVYFGAVLIAFLVPLSIIHITKRRGLSNEEVNP